MITITLTHAEAKLITKMARTRKNKYRRQFKTYYGSAMEKRAWKKIAEKSEQLETKFNDFGIGE